MTKKFTHCLYVCLFMIVTSTSLCKAQNSVLVNFGSDFCSDGASGSPTFSMINNPLGGSPILLSSCSMATQLPDFFSVFIAYNPKNNKIYVADTRSGITKIWILDIGLPLDITCPISIPATPTYSYSYVSNNFEFDNNGDLWSFSNYDINTGTCNMDKFDVTTGQVINTRVLQFPAGNFPDAISSGDLTILPNGRMFATLGSGPSRLYEIVNYSSTSTNATATFLTALPNSCFGIAYLNGQLELTGTNFGGGCYYYDYNISTNVLGAIKPFQNGQLPIDNSSLTPSLGVTKRLLNATKINSNTADLSYEIYVRNIGNVILKDINVADDLAGIYGAGNVSNVFTVFVPNNNAGGLTLNASYNGTTNTDLLTVGQNLPNQTATNTDYFFKLQVRCRVTNLNTSTTYLNSAIGKATIGNIATASLINVTDSSNNGLQFVVDPNNNGNAGEVNENVPTPFFFGALPVRFLTIDASLINKTNSLVRWTVATPTVNADYFEIEYSPDALHWTTLGSMTISNANQSSYQFNHHNLPVGNLYYRIKQYDNDGSYLYSRIAYLKNKNGEVNYSIFPNPANHYVSISSPSNIVGATYIELYDAIGRKLISKVMTTATTDINIAELPTGTYMLKFINNDVIKTEKLLIRH